MATSTVTLTIDIEHDENLPLDAQGIAVNVAAHLATLLGPGRGSRPVKVGFRRHRVGREDGPSTSVFLNSACMTRFGK